MLKTLDHIKVFEDGTLLVLIDEDEYDKIVQENLGLAHVITQLGLNPDNKKLDRKPEDYLCDGNYMEHKRHWFY